MPNNRINTDWQFRYAPLPAGYAERYVSQVRANEMINRAAVILKYKEPFVRWLNEADPCEDDPGITAENANDDLNVYLISDADVENIEEWISLNYKTLFENELEDWYTDESLWPKKRDKKTFHEWFAIECHSVIIDTVGGVIEYDET